MATADLGIRIFLQDAFSGGFGGISQLLRGFADGLSIASGIMDTSASKIAALSSSIEDGGLMVEKYQADFAALQEQITLSQGAIEALQGTGAIGQNLHADLAAGEVLTYEQAIEKGRITLRALQAQGAIFTPAQEESVIKAQADMLMYQQKVRDVEATLPGLELNKWMNAQPIANARAEMEKYDAKVVDTKLKLDTLTQVGFDKQAAQIDAETVAQGKLAEKADLVAAKEAAVTAKMNEQTAAVVAEKEAASGLMTSIGVGVGAGVVLLGLGMALKRAADDAAALQDAMVSVKIAFQATGAQSLALQAQIIAIANTSQFSSKEIADAFASLAEHGFTAADVIKNHMGVAVTNLAQAIKADTVPAAELLSGTMQVFGGHAQEAAHYADMLTTVFYNGVPHIEEIKQAIESAGAQAAGVHWKFQDLAAALDLMAKRGISGSQAGTSLRFMIASLNDPTAKVQSALVSMGIETIHTNNAFLKYQETLKGSSTAGYVAATSFDGTVTSLHQMFAQGQKVAGLRTDQTFYEWAVSAGIVSNKLFDAHGKFKDLSGVVGTLGEALKSIKTPEEFSAWLGEMGGARSGKAFEALLRDAPLTQVQIKQLEAAMNKSGTATKDATIQNETYNAQSKRLSSTITDLWTKLGAPITDTLAPIIGRVADFAGGLQNLLVAQPGIAKFFTVFAIAGVIASGVTLLVLAVGFLGTTLAAVSIPALITTGVLLAIAAAAAVVALHWDTIVKAMRPVIAAFQQFAGATGNFLKPIIADIEKFAGMVGSFFKPVIEGIFRDFGNFTKLFGSMGGPLAGLKVAFGQLIDSFKTLWQALEPAFPFFKFLAGVLGGLFVVAVGVAVAVLVGLATAFVSVLRGIINFVTGSIQFLSGLITFVVGFASLLIALFTGINLVLTGRADLAWAHIQNAFGAMWRGMVQMTQGLGLVLVGVFQATVGAVIGFIAGLVSGVINFFGHLYTVLVGHSIIPDLCNGIIKWISALPGQVLGFIAGLVSGAISRFQSLSSQAVGLAQSLVGGFVSAVSSLPGRVMGIINGMGGMLFSAGSNMVQMLANGITSSVSAVISSATGIATAIANILQHNSPPKSGPLSQGDKSMPRMMAMLAGGITDGTPLLTAAAQKAAAGVAQVFSSPTTARLQGLAGAVPAQSGAASTRPNEYHFHIEVGGKETAQFIMDDITKTLKLNGMSRLYR